MLISPRPVMDPARASFDPPLVDGASLLPETQSPSTGPISVAEASASHGQARPLEPISSSPVEAFPSPPPPSNPSATSPRKFFPRPLPFRVVSSTKLPSQAPFSTEDKDMLRRDDDVNLRTNAAQDKKAEGSGDDDDYGPELDDDDLARLAEIEAESVQPMAAASTLPRMQSGMARKVPPLSSSPYQEPPSDGHHEAMAGRRSYFETSLTSGPAPRDSSTRTVQLDALSTPAVLHGQPHATPALSASRGEGDLLQPLFEEVHSALEELRRRCGHQVKALQGEIARRDLIISQLRDEMSIALHGRLPSRSQSAPRAT